MIKDIKDILRDIGIILVFPFLFLLWPIFLIKDIIKKILTFSRRRRLRKYEYKFSNIKINDYNSEYSISSFDHKFQYDDKRSIYKKIENTYKLAKNFNHSLHEEIQESIVQIESIRRSKKFQEHLKNLKDYQMIEKLEYHLNIGSLKYSCNEFYTFQHLIKFEQSISVETELNEMKSRIDTIVYLSEKIISLSEESDRFERKLWDLVCRHNFQSVIQNLNIFIRDNIYPSSLNPDQLNDLFDLIFKIYDIFSFLLPVYEINNTKLINSVNKLLDNFFATDFRNQEFEKCKNIVNNIINHKLFVVSLLIKVYDKLKFTEYLNKLKIEYNYFDDIIQHVYDEVQKILKIDPPQYKIETDHYIQSVIDEAEKCYETACELEEKHKSLYFNALELKEKNIRKSDHRLIDNYINTIKQLFHSSEFKTQDFDKHREKLNEISELFDIIKKIKNYPSGYKGAKKQILSCFKDENRDLIFLLAGCSNNLSPLTDLLHNQLKNTKGYKILNESGKLYAINKSDKKFLNRVYELADKVKELNVPDFYELYGLLGRLEIDVPTSIESVYNQSFDKKVSMLTEEWYEIYNWHNQNYRIKFPLSEPLYQTIDPHETYTNNFGMSFVLIQPGTFVMGSPEDESRCYREVQHSVTLTQAFYIQTTVVTQKQWKAVMGSNPSLFYNCGDDFPVTNVSWIDAQEFIEKLNLHENENRYTLPTEAQWEYAARAGSTSALANGNLVGRYHDLDNNLNAMGWYRLNSGGKTHPVAQKNANAWGLYDMHGNVWEWCNDCYDSYSTNSVTDPEVTSSDDFKIRNKVIRGGSYRDSAENCRSAVREARDYKTRYSEEVGLRILRKV